MDLQDPHVLLSKFIYIQTIKLLQIDHYHSGFFNPTLPSAQQGKMYKRDGLKHLKATKLKLSSYCCNKHDYYFCLLLFHFRLS